MWNCERLGSRILKNGWGGGGKKGGGGAEYVKRRMHVLNRMRNLAPLSKEQKNDWDLLIQEWDKLHAEALGEDWPSMFAEYVQAVLDQLMEGINWLLVSSCIMKCDGALRTWKC